LIKPVHDGQIPPDHHIYRFQPPKHTQTRDRAKFFCACGGHFPRGRQKETGDPRGRWVGQSRGQKRPVLDLFLNIFLIVLLGSPHRETPKNVMKKIEKKIGFGFFVDFFVKSFDTIFCKTFFVVFLLHTAA
jgi:hypothetical protein